MKTTMTIALLAAFAMSPAFAGDDNPGKHNGHDDAEALSDDSPPPGKNDISGFGLDTAISNPGIGAEGVAPGEGNGANPFPGYGTATAPGQTD